MTARQIRPCLECGHPFTPTSATAEFCRRPCRQAWNNRRMTRGAELFDLFMTHRFERAEAGRLKVLTAMNRLASEYRREDEQVREARRSWQRARAVLDRHPSLLAQIMVRTGATTRRARVDGAGTASMGRRNG